MEGLNLYPDTLVLPKLSLKTITLQYLAVVAAFFRQLT